jgi:GNAT superfamily N-acetyltransferase
MRPEDLKQVNSVFAKAFSNARVEEGLKQHRVSPCRLEFLRMYQDRSGDGAVVSVDRGKVTGFNFNHLFGSTGWMGPVAVTPGYQGAGVGKSLVGAGVDYLKGRGAAIIGLETMPRNFKNIGFYLRLGFKTGPLCVDMVSPAHSGPGIELGNSARCVNLGECSGDEREMMMEGAGSIAEAICPGLDYGDEIKLNERHRFGDTVLLVEGGEVAGFAVCHFEPYGQLEDRRELKVTVLALRPEGGEKDLGVLSESSRARLSALLAGVRSLAAREKLLMIRVHPRGDKWSAMRELIRWGYNVAYSDLRMWLAGFEESEPESCVHFCRWQ